MDWVGEQDVVPVSQDPSRIIPGFDFAILGTYLMTLTIIIISGTFDESAK